MCLKMMYQGVGGMWRQLAKADSAMVTNKGRAMVVGEQK